MNLIQTILMVEKLTVVVSEYLQCYCRRRRARRNLELSTAASPRHRVIQRDIEDTWILMN